MPLILCIGLCFLLCSAAHGNKADDRHTQELTGTLSSLTDETRCINSMDMVREEDEDIEESTLLQRKMFTARKLGSNTAHSELDDREYECDLPRFQRTQHLLMTRNFDELKRDSCVSSKDLHALQLGVEEPEDLIQDALPHLFDKQQMAKGCKKQLLPKVLYIGLPHAGSTTMTSLMTKHPELSWGTTKEHYFFSTRIFYQEWIERNCLGPEPNVTECNHKAIANISVSAYKEQFTVPCGVKMTIDATPVYFSIGNPQLKQSSAFPIFRQQPGLDAVKEVKDILGDDVKIIFAVRDPLEFLASTKLTSSLTAIECIADSIDTWKRVFPSNQFLFLDYATMFQDLPGTIDSIFEFIGVSPRKFDIPNDYVSGRRRSKNMVPSHVRERLVSNSYYQGCKDRLENLTGLGLAWEGVN